MKQTIELRRHVILLAPDVLLFLVGAVLLLEIPWIARQLSGERVLLLQILCEGLGLLLILTGIIHGVCWLGFRVIIHPHEIVVRRCWFLQKRLDRIQRLNVQLMQSRWEARLDKGTLVLYAPAGDIITLPHLAHVSQLSPNMFSETLV